MCIHEQCVPNLAVPPWRPGYEANECVYISMLVRVNIMTVVTECIINHVNGCMCTINVLALEMLVNSKSQILTEQTQESVSKV